MIGAFLLCCILCCWTDVKAQFEENFMDRESDEFVGSSSDSTSSLFDQETNGASQQSNPDTISTEFDTFSSSGSSSTETFSNDRLFASTFSDTTFLRLPSSIPTDRTPEEISRHYRHLSRYVNLRALYFQNTINEFLRDTAELSQRSASITEHQARLTQHDNEHQDRTQAVNAHLNELDKASAVCDKRITELALERSKMDEEVDQLMIKIAVINLKRDQLSRQSAHEDDKKSALALQIQRLNGELVHLSTESVKIQDRKNDLDVESTEIAKKISDIAELIAGVTIKINYYGYLGTYYDQLGDYFLELIDLHLFPRR